MSQDEQAVDETTTLIWDYLEGEISDEQAERLSSALSERASVREQFVESAVLHGMLFDYFNRGAASQPQQAAKRKRPGRSSAA